LLPQLAEDKNRASIGKVEQFLGAVARHLKQPLPRLDAEDEQSKGELQSQSPGNRLQADGAPVGRKGKGQT
jgi:hypothetical protein